MLRVQVSVSPNGDPDVRAVPREAVYTSTDTRLRILHNTNRSELRFRARPALRQRPVWVKHHVRSYRVASRFYLPSREATL
jgi:hypothetical protein